jgi:hypothetical protein
MAFDGVGSNGTKIPLEAGSDQARLVSEAPGICHFPPSPGARPRPSRGEKERRCRPTGRPSSRLYEERCRSFTVAEAETQARSEFGAQAIAATGVREAVLGPARPKQVEGAARSGPPNYRRPSCKSSSCSPADRCKPRRTSVAVRTLRRPESAGRERRPGAAPAGTACRTQRASSAVLPRECTRTRPRQRAPKPSASIQRTRLFRLSAMPGD